MDCIFTCSNIFSFLVKEKVKDEVDLKVNTNEDMDYFTKRKKIEEAAWKLFNKACEFNDTFKDSSNIPYYDLDNENPDDLPVVQRDTKFMTERERDDAMWQKHCEINKGSKAVEYMNMALDLLENRIQLSDLQMITL